MKWFKEIWKNSNVGARISFWVLLFLTTILGVVAFILPPLGVIDESVINFATMVNGFACAGVALECVIEGINVKFKHGNVEIEAGKANAN